MKEIMFNKIFSKELIAGIIINLFIGSTALLIFIIVFNAFFDDWKTPLSVMEWLVYLFIVVSIYVLKFSLLPLYWFLINKYSKNKYIIDLLSQIKADKSLQNNFLIGGVIFDFIFILLNTVPTSIHYHYDFVGFMQNILIWTFVYLITGAGLLGSYLALFYGKEPKN
jgi:hypothetical protein